MNHHRPPLLAADCPDLVQLGVVHRHELAILVANAQAKGLVNLQPFGAASKALLQGRGLAIAPAGLVDAGKIDLGECQKAIRMCSVERGKCLVQPVTPSAVQVHHRAHPGLVHFRQVGATRSGESWSLPLPR